MPELHGRRAWRPEDLRRGRSAHRSGQPSGLPGRGRQEADVTPDDEFRVLLEKPIVFQAAHMPLQQDRAHLDRHRALRPRRRHRALLRPRRRHCKLDCKRWCWSPNAYESSKFKDEWPRLGGGQEFGEHSSGVNEILRTRRKTGRHGSGCRVHVCVGQSHVEKPALKFSLKFSLKFRPIGL